MRQGGLNVHLFVGHYTRGVVNKLVKAGPDSGYDPNLEFGLGYELWATLRYCFFTQDQIDIEKDQAEGFTLNVEPYGLHIAQSCPAALQEAARSRFGKCYMGCIH
jgi:hypothetical protein